MSKPVLLMGGTGSIDSLSARALRADDLALGVSMMLERLAGLGRAAPSPPGWYFPFRVRDHDAYLSCLQAEGGGLIARAAQ